VPGNRRSLEKRVADAASAALAEHDHVSAVDVLVGLGWLHPSNVDRWRRGRAECLEPAVQVGADRIAAALEALRGWAGARGLSPIEVGYPAHARPQRALRFSVGGDPDVERAYRTHWVPADLSERERTRLVEQTSRAPDLVVVSALREWFCAECGGTGELLLMEDAGPICMRCADMDHLVFLPSGDAALTRRARKASRLCAVVVRFSRARKRYERQGLLVEEDALERAERECLADAEARARRREREQVRRADDDARFQTELAREIERLYPACPPGRVEQIARHTAVRGSGRVGRSAAGRALDPAAIALAVAASIRHLDTPYDELLMAGMTRAEAREHVSASVEQILGQWQVLVRRRSPQDLGGHAHEANSSEREVP
jgi:hypothetical protein